MNNNYDVIKNIERIKKGECTRFLDSKMQLELKKKLRKNEYLIFYPYPESEKVIFYKYKEPNICLLEIVTKNKLEHRDILGTVFSLGLNSSMFGDIVIENDRYYIYVLNEIKDYFINKLTIINKNEVNLEIRDLNLLDNYKREYQNIEIIVSSERIDTVIAHLIGINRNKIRDLIKEKNIILNYEILNNNSKKIEVGDIFSIRKYGKYKYLGIVKLTKSNNLILKINKYI